MASRVMTLRRDDRCSRCAAATPAGERAFWDSEMRNVVCLACVSGSAPRPAQPNPTTLPAPQPIERGVAGASARAHAEQLGSATRRDEWSRTNWEKGADGEERLAQWLEEQLEGRLEETVCLHDRSVPGTNGNLDHLVVTTSGVWIIDAKNHTGLVEHRDLGSAFRLDDRLYVDGRDRTSAVGNMGWQVNNVRGVLEPMGFASVPVHPVLCFIDSEWRMFARPFRIDGVLVGWPKAITKSINQATPVMTDHTVQTISTELSARFPASRPTRSDNQGGHYVPARH